MKRGLLESKIRSTNTAYLFWFILGSHYAYLGKWGLQFLFWFTLGGFGIWALVDFFTMSSKVDTANASIYEAIVERERKRDVELLKTWR
jgi:hypothetical protein